MHKHRKNSYTKVLVYGSDKDCTKTCLYSNRIGSFIKASSTRAAARGFAGHLHNPVNQTWGARVYLRPRRAHRHQRATLAAAHKAQLARHAFIQLEGRSSEAALVFVVVALAVQIRLRLLKRHMVASAGKSMGQTKSGRMR